MVLAKNFQEAFENVYLFFIKTELKINNKEITLETYSNGCSIIFPKRKVITVDKIKKFIEKYNPRFGYKLRLHPSKLFLFWGANLLVKFKKRSIKVNFYGIGAPKENYETYMELIKDLILLYEPDAKL